MDNWSYFTPINGAITFIEGFSPLCTSTACELQVSADEDFFTSRRYSISLDGWFSLGKGNVCMGSLYYQPNQCTVIREILQNYHRCVLFDSPKMGPPLSDGFLPIFSEKITKNHMLVAKKPRRNLSGPSSSSVYLGF